MCKTLLLYDDQKLNKSNTLTLSLVSKSRRFWTDPLSISWYISTPTGITVYCSNPSRTSHILNSKSARFKGLLSICGWCSMAMASWKFSYTKMWHTLDCLVYVADVVWPWLPGSLVIQRYGHTLDCLVYHMKKYICCKKLQDKGS